MIVFLAWNFDGLCLKNLPVVQLMKIAVVLDHTGPRILAESVLQVPDSILMRFIPFLFHFL